MLTPTTATFLKEAAIVMFSERLRLLVLERLD